MPQAHYKQSRPVSLHAAALRRFAKRRVRDRRTTRRGACAEICQIPLSMRWPMGRAAACSGPLALVVAALLLQPCARAAEVLCRKCGAVVTDTGGHIRWPSPSAAIATHAEPTLGPDAKTFTFRNPVGAEMRVATFANGTHLVVPTVLPDPTSSFFAPYRWRTAACDQCGAHLGWQFSLPHDDGHSPTTTPAAAPSGLVNGAAASPALDTDMAGHLLDSLRGVCLLYAEGWWTYKWCYKGDIRQFHPDEQGQVTVDWSLGQYDAAGQAQRVRPGTLSMPGVGQVPFVSHFHRKGQVRYG